ncbi:NUDIX domain-containing protein [Niallia circulans]|uniref:NUDIX domain-containing protein n=1 Tax=Niallia circulans TaxID=1397 RepID=A0A553SLQ8_NIACI|nr:NUDIX hydrolase [Niallia circulans]TRZ37924.1 NUDIX domain-containing protein [Niallia circulans]
MSYVADLRKLIGSHPIITVGATIIIVNEQGDILFQQRSDTLDWGLPEGAMELTETLEEAAWRELKEETGLHAEAFALIDVFSGPEYYFHYPNGDETYSVIHLYHGKRVSGQLEMTDGESLNLHYFAEDKLPEKIEKRAQALFDAAGERLWKLKSSFVTTGRKTE